MFVEFLLWIFPFLRYSHWDAARNGRNDGRVGVPGGEQEKQPPYIMQLKNFAEENIARLAQRWKREDEKLLAQYCRSQQEAETLEEYRNKAGDDLITADGDEKEAHEEYVKHFHLPKVWYWILVVSIGIFELPLNSVVFQLFGENQVFTVMTAISLALILPFCAHFLGGFLKQGILREDKFTTHTVLTIAMILVPLTVLGGVAYLREKFFEGAGVQELLNVQMDFTTVTVTFFVINLLIFLVATVASYVAHDPIAIKYRHNLMDARKLKKNAVKRIDMYERRLAENLERQEEIRATRIKRFGYVQQEAKERRDIVQKLMSAYHTHNVRVRGAEDQMPKCFGIYPPVDVPAVIEPGNDILDRADLDWDCRASG